PPRSTVFPYTTLFVRVLVRLLQLGELGFEVTHLRVIERRFAFLVGEEFLADLSDLLERALDLLLGGFEDGHELTLELGLVLHDRSFLMLCLVCVFCHREGAVGAGRYARLRMCSTASARRMLISASLTLFCGMLVRSQTFRRKSKSADRASASASGSAGTATADASNR